MYDIDRKEWSKIDTQGDRPSPRYDFASCYDGNNLYIFGGKGYLQFNSVL